MGDDLLRVGLLGLGTVGGSVYRLLAGEDGPAGPSPGRWARVVRIAVREPGRDRPVSPPREILTADPLEVVDDPEVDVVVEAVGGLSPVLGLVARALRARKHVVTANKELMAHHGARLRELARAQEVGLRCEASVGGAIPILSSLEGPLATESVHQIIGVVNGTTNFVLSEMADRGLSLEEAVAAAERRGYAEADPERDLSGYDSACKMAIMAALAFGAPVDLKGVRFSGLEGIEADDLALARGWGYAVRLLGLARRIAGGAEILVAPHLVPSDHPLARVRGADNAIQIWGRSSGLLTLSGPGAGGPPTATAVVGDLAAIARGAGGFGGLPHAGAEALGTRQGECAFYLRVRAVDDPTLPGRLGEILTQHGVEPAGIVGREADGRRDWLVTTGPTGEDALRDAACIIEGLGAVRGPCTLLRFLPEDEEARPGVLGLRPARHPAGAEGS